MRCVNETVVNDMSLVKRQKIDTAGTHSSLVQLHGNGTGGRLLYNDAVALEGHQGAVLLARFSHDGTKIASGGMDKSVMLWRLPVAQEDINYGVVKGHKGAVTAVAWTYDDLALVTASSDATVGFWDAETGSRTRKCTGHSGVVNSVDVSTDSVAVSVGDDGMAYLWDLRQKTHTGGVSTSYPLLATAFNHQGSTFYIGGIDPTVLAYDVRKTDEALWQAPGQDESITSLAINSDDSVLVSRSMSGGIRTYSAKEFVPEGIPRTGPYSYVGAPSGNEYNLISCCFSTDNVTIFSGSEDKTVTSWDFTSRRVTNKFEGHRGCVIDVDYHPDRILLSTSTDGSIIVREV